MRTISIFGAVAGTMLMLVVWSGLTNRANAQDMSKYIRGGLPNDSYTAGRAISGSRNPMPGEQQQVQQTVINVRHPRYHGYRGPTMYHGYYPRPVTVYPGYYYAPGAVVYPSHSHYNPGCRYGQGYVTPYRSQFYYGGPGVSVRIGF